jgi:hypothetical protein
MPRPTTADIGLEHHGSVVVLELRSVPALEWANNRLETESWMWIGVSRLAIDIRNSAAVVALALDEGFTVEA